MACYSDACKARSAFIVIGVSVLIGIIGIITVIFGGMLTGAGFTKLQQLASIQSVVSEFSGALSKAPIAVIIFGVIVLLTGVCGCLAGKKKNAMFTVPFMICTGVMMLVMLALAIICVAASTHTDQIQTSVCTALENNQNYQKMLDDYGKAVRHSLCTK